MNSSALRLLLFPSRSVIGEHFQGRIGHIGKQSIGYEREPRWGSDACSNPNVRHPGRTWIGAVRAKKRVRGITS